MYIYNITCAVIGCMLCVCVCCMTSDVGSALRFHSTLQEGVLGKGDVLRIRGVYTCGRVRTSVVLCVRLQLVHLVLPPSPYPHLWSMPHLCRRGVGPDSSNWRDHSEPAHRPQAISPSHPTAHEKCVDYLSKGKTQKIMCIVCLYV